MSSFFPNIFLDRLLGGFSKSPYKRGQHAAASGNDSKAAAFWLTGARAGDADCKLALADALWNGKGVLRDMRSALRWFEEAAEAGKAQAQARLAGVYATGIGITPGEQKPAKTDDGDLVVPRDRAKARHWARLASQQDHVEAQVLLGWLCSMEGDPDGLDISQAIEWYSRASEKGSAPAMVGLAGLISVGSVPGQGPEDAVQLYRRAAELGNKTAFYYLGAAYMNGTGVEADPVVAYKWLQRAADEGVIGAFRALGMISLNGSGGQPVDVGQAETWLRRAAVKGDVDSMVLLADLHASKQAQVPNQAEAIFLYVAASDQGNMKATTALGLAHLNGNGVELNHTLAVKLFEKAADHHAEARFQLALCHLLGRGVPADPALAAEHLLKAAEQKHPDATYNYGTLLYHGNGVPQDRKAAFDFYIASAELGSASGQFRVAHAHTLGKELPLDNDRAITLFTAAAAQGHLSAQINMARMLLLHRPDERAALEKLKEQLREPARSGVMEAITMLAELLWRLDRDAEGALALLRQSAAMGDPLAGYVKDMINTSPSPGPEVATIAAG